MLLDFGIYPLLLCCLYICFLLSIARELVDNKLFHGCRFAQFVALRSLHLETVSRDRSPHPETVRRDINDDLHLQVPKICGQTREVVHLVFFYIIMLLVGIKTEHFCFCIHFWHCPNAMSIQTSILPEFDLYCSS